MGWQFGRNTPKEIKKNFITAVRAMHIEGMAHNDLHMGNVMVDNVSRRVKLIDFGLASLRSDDDTFRGERGSRLLRKELESIPDMLNFGKTGSKIIRTKYEDALQLVEDIADAETGYYHRKNHGWAREEYLDRLGWDKAEFIINRYYDNLTRIVELRPDRPNGRSY
jgi:serine/threonine protein kinase